MKFTQDSMSDSSNQDRIIMSQDEMEELIFDYYEVSFDIRRDQGWDESDNRPITVDDSNGLTLDEKIKLMWFKMCLPTIGMLQIIMKDMCLKRIIRPGSYELIYSDSSD